MENHKKKILFAITKGNFGGAQKYVFDLATNIDKEKYEVVVACGGGDALKNKLQGKNIKVIELESSQRDVSFKKDFKLYKEIRRIILQEKPDILHLNSSKIGGVGALAGRMCGVKKIIFTGHGWAFNENRNLISKFIILFLHWITIILSHTTIAVSKKAKKDIDWLPFIKNKIKVVYNGIENFETISREDSRKILCKENCDHKTIIYTIGELHKNKGIDIAIKGLSMLPENIKNEIVYSIAGDGEEKENLITQVNDLNLGKTVHFLGYTENAKKLLNGADLFLLPSRTEAFPYVILEAGIIGLPIISSSVGGIPEVIDSMENGILIHSKNPKEIAEAIIYAWNQKDKQKKFSEEIKKTVMNSFSLDKMLRETTELYK